MHPPSFCVKSCKAFGASGLSVGRGEVLLLLDDVAKGSGNESGGGSASAQVDCVLDDMTC